MSNTSTPDTDLQIFPPGVAVAVWDGTARVQPEEILLGVEWEATTKTSVRRLVEFAQGRACARQAMAALGLPPEEIPVGPHREPIWPAGVTGSITHCEGLVAAAVARSTDYDAIGLDAERRNRLFADIEATVVSPAEQQGLLGGLGAREPWGSLLVFAAKEACFKAVFPLVGHYFGFADVHIGVERQPPSLTVRSTGTTPHPVADLLPNLRGRFQVTDTHVIAGITLSRSSR